MRTTLKIVEAKTYQGKPNGFKITLADGTEGNLLEKESDKNLKAGDEVECVTTDYVSKAGKHSNLFTITRVSQSEIPQSTPAKAQEPKLPNLKDFNGSKTITDMKFEARKYLMKLIVSLVLGGKLELKEVKEYYTDWTGMADESIAEINE